MSDRDEALKALHTTVGTVDPLHAASEGYGKAIREVQKLAHGQGVAMSAALDNNARLWAEYKRLKGIEGRCQSLERQNEQLRTRNREITEAFETLQANGGDRYKTLYEQTRKTLNLYLGDALDESELKERVDVLDAQRAALDSDGVAKARQPDRGAIDAHMAMEGVSLEGEEAADLGDL